MKIKRTLLICCLWGCMTAMTIAENDDIIFIAGPDSHGWGCHEHSKGCVLLADALNKCGLGIKAEVFKDGWPEESAFKNAKAIVVYCDGGDKHLFLGKEFQVRKLSDRGVGVVCIHYATEVLDPTLRAYFLNWIGGYFEVNWSVNPIWTPSPVKLARHPVTRGVSSFEIKDEWYYHIRFRDNMKGVTPVLSALPDESTLAIKDGPRCGSPALRKELKDGELQHLSWVSVNENGSRGFGFTGGHYHCNWANDDVRKLVLNGIIWAAGIDVPATGVKSETPVILQTRDMSSAIAKNDIEDLKLHITSGENVNAQNSSGWAALHYAAVRNNLTAGALLIKSGANVNLQTKSLKTPLHFCAARGYLEFAKLLVSHGADLGVAERDGWTPLHFAAEKDELDTAAFLIKSGSDVNALSVGGGTPLHEAAASSSKEMIELLVANGADVSIKAKNGKTALDYAKELENTDAVKVLSK